MSACLGYGQDAVGPQQPIFLRHADSIMGTEDGSRQRIFIGKVHFEQGNVTVRCKKAIQHLDAEVVELIGDVNITQGAVRIKSPYIHYDVQMGQAWTDKGLELWDGKAQVSSSRGLYFTRRAIANFKGSVRVHDDSLRLNCDSLEYNRTSKDVTAVGDVVAWLPRQSRVINADTIWRQPSLDKLLARGKATAWEVAFHNESIDAKRQIRANELLTISGSERTLKANGAAEFIAANVAARADTIILLDNLGLTSLHGAPVLWMDSTLLVGHSLLVYFNDKSVDSILSEGAALLVSRTDTLRPDRFDQIKGDTIYIRLNLDTIRQIIAWPDARSVYWRVEEDTPEGVGIMSSDTIIVNFDEGKPDEITWLGGITGEHQPEHFANRQIDAFRVPGFMWRTDRPSLLPVPFLWSFPSLKDALPPDNAKISSQEP